MNGLRIIHRLLLRPLLAEPGRALLTVAAVALGVAVVVAIDLAGDAAAGSFRSSMESLTGDADYEITAVGGLDERLLADLAALPYPLELSPRVEGYADNPDTGAVHPVFGLDLIGDTTLKRQAPSGVFRLEGVERERASWVGRRVAQDAGENIELRINDRLEVIHVVGILDADGFAGASVEDVVIIDIAEAQRLLSRPGLLDRIQVHTPDDDRDWPALLQEALPSGVELAPAGSRATENQKMLGAFRWNLRVLSWLSLIVGAFLIYNTIAVSVVRRRGEIGVLRAIGATRRFVRWAFLSEAALFGAAGTVLGVLLGRAMAEGAVGLLGMTVRTLYITSAPGEIALTPARLAAAALAGVGVALLSAWQPAAEAARIAPTEAMARGRRDYEERLRVRRNLAWGAVVAVAAAGCAALPPVEGKPVGGYLAAVLLIAASALAVPAFVAVAAAHGAHWAHRIAGVEAFLGARSVGGPLARTSILVGALSTAVAMMVSVGIMVGSFRETVLVWMDRQVRADLYIRAAGDPASDRFPTIGADLPDTLAALDGVAGVGRLRLYPVRYQGLPATLAGGDLHIEGARPELRFLQGGGAPALDRLRTEDTVVVSEPFARKHGVWTGDSLGLPLQGKNVDLDVLGVYYDYSNERGTILTSLETLRRHVPDPQLSSIAIHLEPGVDPEVMREAVVEAARGRDLYVATNARLRREAIAIFDRTFAVTWALEAVAITVAILGMAGALAALVIDRRREIAVLRFLGASGAQVRRLILTESGLLGLLSIVVGAGLGALLSLVLIFVINKQSFGWTIQLHWPVGLLVLALGGIYLASLAAGVLPARVAARMSPIEAVHEE